MLHWLKGLLGGSAQPQSAPSRPVLPADVANAAEAGGEQASTDFLRREPILSREHMVCGYEWNLERPAMHRARHPSAQHFLDRSLLDRVMGDKLAGVLDRRLTFIALSPLSLDLPQLDTLARSGAILSLSDAAVTDSELAGLLDRARRLKADGLRLACPITFAGGPLEPLLALAGFILVDVVATDPAGLLDQLHTLQKDHPEARLMARNVDAFETLQACKALNFEFFQGSYVTERRNWREPRRDTSRMVVAQLISQLKQNPKDFSQLAHMARLDPMLAFKLLRFINSAGVGLRYKVASLERAMTFLGREGLYRWLSLLLFYSGRSEALDDALREIALARGRLVELLSQGRVTRQESEMAFITGLLSLMDILFHMPLEEAIAQLSLPDEILAALLRYEGKYGDLLALAIACEQGEQAELASLAARCGLDPETVSARHVEALVWAVEFAENKRSDMPKPG